VGVDVYREGEVRYTLYRDRPALERQAKFQAGCRDGHTEIVSILTVFKYIFKTNLYFGCLGMFFI